MRTRITLSILILSSLFGLSACGGSATVDKTAETASTSIQPLDRSSHTSDAGASDGGKASDAGASAAGASDGKASDGKKASDGEKAASTTEPTASAASASASAEKSYLKALKGAGVNVEGIEDQLVGAAQAACNEQDMVTVPAVAGQLIEQGRTKLPHDQVIAAIEDNAHAVYCQ